MSPSRRSKSILALGTAALALSGMAAVRPHTGGQDAGGVHIVLVVDPTSADAYGWASAFSQLTKSDVAITITPHDACNGESRRDQDARAAALAAKGDYYIIHFHRCDHPGAEGKTDPAALPSAGVVRYVDEVRANGSVAVLVTSLLGRAFDGCDPAKPTFEPVVDALKHVAASKHVALIDLDALRCQQTVIREPADAGNTSHDTPSGLVLATLVARELRRVVPALAPFLRDVTVRTEPEDLPKPLPLLSLRARSELITPVRVPMGRVYPLWLRLERYARRMTHNGDVPELAQLPPLVSSPALVVAWDYLPTDATRDAGCGFATNAPTRVETRDNGVGGPRRESLMVIFERDRIRDLLEPYESDFARVRWLAAIDPARLRAESLLVWIALKPCEGRPVMPLEVAALITTEDIKRWLVPTAQPLAR